MSNMYAAKRAIIDRLRTVAALDNTSALFGVQVAYTWPGQTAEMMSVYGGGFTFEQLGEEDVVDGDDRVTKEDGSLNLIIRVAQSPPGQNGTRDSDEVAESIGDAIEALIQDEPHIAGGHSVSRVISGIGDTDPIDDQAVSLLLLRIRVESYLG